MTDLIHFFLILFLCLFPPFSFFFFLVSSWLLNQVAVVVSCVLVFAGSCVLVFAGFLYLGLLARLSPVRLSPAVTGHVPAHVQVTNGAVNERFVLPQRRVSLLDVV